MKYEIKIYETPSGKRPFDVWLNGLSDKKAQAIIDLRIERLGIGVFGDCEPIGNGVYELRIHLGPG